MSVANRDLDIAGIKALYAGVVAPSMADDFTDTIATKGLVQFGTAPSGTLEVNSDEDWFAVQLQAGTTYLLDASGAVSGGGTLTSPYLTLYNGNCSPGVAPDRV